MTRLTIRHETRYSYEKPVSFGAHRLLVRPRDSHAVRILDASLAFTPQGSTRWMYDALGNSVCWLHPEGEAASLSIVSQLTLERYPAPITWAQIEDPHTATPIVYDPADRTVLAPFIEPAAADYTGELLAWLRGRLARGDEPALALLMRLNSAVHDEFDYAPRVEEGTQSPGDTARMRRGACRDFAWLLVEAARRLGFAARFVTGYLHAPDETLRGAGATHAWCQVFLPGLGWTDLDPTNGLVESADLIPVAVSRTPEAAAPINGAIFGDPGRSHLAVEVQVRLADAGAKAAA
ncbi:MAG: transglutaminase family protein [Caulobacteraceae bacterium]|nr:transglutaminase family protein [Caulobacteraceae bacterium]